MRDFFRCWGLKGARVVVPVAAAVALLCGVGYIVGRAEREQIVIVSTNDMHASIDRLPQLVTLVQGLRSRHDNLLVVDGGDYFSGNPYVDMADMRGEPMIDLMNMVGYDVVTLGNHEFDYGQRSLKRNLDRLEAEVVSANADYSATILRRSAEPYKIVTVDGVRMAFLGLIELTDLGVPSTLPSNVTNIRFRDGVEASMEYRFLRDSADVVVALSHMGYRSDSLMVCVNDMFDLVIGGHSHTYIARGRTINGAVVTQTGSRLANVGVTYIDVKGGVVQSIRNETVSLEGVRPDAAAVAYLERVKEDSPLNSPIGKLDGELSKTGLKNLVTDVMRHMSGAEIALQNSGAIRIESLAAGEVTYADIYSMEPFANHIVTQYLTLEQIKELLMTHYTEPGITSTDLSPSGMTYRVVLDSDGSVEDIECYGLDGAPLVAGRRYLIATNNYVASAYIYAGQNRAKKMDDRTVKVSDSVILAFQSVEVLQGDNSERAQVVQKGQP